MLHFRHLYRLLTQPFSFVSAPEAFNISLEWHCGQTGLSLTSFFKYSRCSWIKALVLAWLFMCSIKRSTASSTFLFSSPIFPSAINFLLCFLKNVATFTNSLSFGLKFLFMCGIYPKICNHQHIF